MHARLLALLVLGLLPGTSAQGLPNATLTEIGLGAEPGPYDPGATVPFQVTGKRTCSSVAFVMGEQDVDLVFRAAKADGSDPEHNESDPVTAVLHFPQQVCAMGAAQVGSVDFGLVLPTDAARNATLRYLVEFRPQPVEAPEIGVAKSVFVGITLMTTPEPLAPAIEETPVKESPGPVAGLLAFGLAGLALALRRRAA